MKAIIHMTEYDNHLNITTFMQTQNRDGHEQADAKLITCEVPH